MIYFLVVTDIQQLYNRKVETKKKS